MRFAMTVIFAFTAVAAQAASPFTVQRITIHGSTNVNATALNKQGTIVGIFASGAGLHGFIRNGADLTVLPRPPHCRVPCIVTPTAINRKGEVAGISTSYGQPSTFLWTGSQYRNAARVYTGTGGAGPVGLNATGVEFYNFYTGSGNYLAMEGKAPHFVAFATGGLFADSINSSGAVAGTVYEGPCSEGANSGCVFAGTPNGIVTLAPPGALGASGGYINDSGQVAGSYFTGFSGPYAGFIYDGSTYTSFSAPGQADTMAVQGINNAGRVVGIYGQTGQAQHGFLFNGTGSVSFGTYPAADIVKTTINDRGEILLSDSSGGVYTSYMIHCHGATC